MGALILAVLLTSAWEWHWRAFGAVAGIREDDALWARERRRIDHGDGDATVLIGSSRTLFDVQLPVWERHSGRRPIQLSTNGTSPLFELEDLADDPSFTGKLLMGVAPDVFFSGFQYHKGLVAYTRKESPSDRVGKWLSMTLVEPWLAFYNPDFALFTVLRRQPWPERAGLSRLRVRQIEVTEADRNTYMWSKVETDMSYRNLIRSTWAQDFDDPPPDPKEAADADRTRDDQIARAAAAVQRLRARNVPVILVREPSAGEYLSYEARSFPRQSTWDVLVAQSKAPAIHFQDYPELQGYTLPDWSHMTHESANRYTDALYRIIERKYPLPGGDSW